MKYAKELNHVMQRLPPSLQDASISYKLWKKRCNKLCQDSCQEILVHLNQECKKVETAFVLTYKKCIHPPRALCWRCTTSAEDAINTDTLLMFANMNSKTLYKICKRLQKQLHDPTLMQWLISIRAAHAYEFLGGHHTTHLTLMQTTPLSVECPLCLQTTSHKYILIYCCGHYACVGCTLAYVHMKSYNGAWYHLMMYAQHKPCPFCRYDKAFVRVTTA
jgi:hypothetical protein